MSPSIWWPILFVCGVIVLGTVVVSRCLRPTATFPIVGRTRAWLGHIALFIVAMMVLAVSVDVRQARGPYWLGSNSDPEYAYLLNALRLVHGLAPAHRDHPGTPVQMLAAVVVQLRNGLPGSEELTSRVIRDPERNLDAVRCCITLSLAVVLALTGVIAYRKTGSFIDALCLQAAPFLTVTGLLEIPRVRPEPILLGLSLLLSLAVLHQLHERNASRLRAYAAIYGCLVGLSLATKITALPLLLVPLILLPTRSLRAWFIAAACAAFLAGILPIISYLPGLAEWIWEVVSHQRRYGNGRAGFANLEVVLKFTPELALRELCFVAIVGLSLGVIVWDLVRRSHAGRPHLEARALLAVVASQMTQWLLTLKGGQYHYLLPAEGLVGLNLILLIRRARRVERKRTLLLVLGTSIALLLAVVQTREFLRCRADLIAERDHQLSVQHQVLTRYKDWTKVCAYRTSSVEHALYFGDLYSDGFFYPWLRQIYPDPSFVYFDIWHEEFLSSQGPIGKDQLMRTHQRLIFRGFQLVPDVMSEWRLIGVNIGHDECLYEWTAEPSSEPSRQVQPRKKRVRKPASLRPRPRSTGRQ